MWTECVGCGISMPEGMEACPDCCPEEQRKEVLQGIASYHENFSEEVLPKAGDVRLVRRNTRVLLVLKHPDDRALWYSVIVTDSAIPVADADVPFRDLVARCGHGLWLHIATAMIAYKERTCRVVAKAARKIVGQLATGELQTTEQGRRAEASLEYVLAEKKWATVAHKLSL